MSTKSTISTGDGYHLFEEVILDDEPLTHVLLEVERPSKFAVEKQFPNYDANVTLAIPVAAMDTIALAWIRKRRLL